MNPNRAHVATSIVLSVALAAGCGGNTAEPAAPAHEEWRGSVVTEGDLTNVVTHGGSVWPEPRLVEDLSIGMLDGADEYVFGNVTALSADSRGNLYVLDRPATAIRSYDATGQHRFDIGRQGSGPGEFELPFTLGITADDRIVVRDQRLARVSEFSSETGELIADWRSQGNGAGAVTPDGRVWVRSIAERGDSGIAWAVREHSPDGPGDMVLLPPEINERAFVMEDRRGLEMGAARAANMGMPLGVLFTPFSPQRVWAIGANGSLVVGEADEYSFWVREADGHQRVISRQIDSVAVDPDEAAWHREMITTFWREVNPDFVWANEIPATKRAYRSIRVDDSGRFWVLRETEGRRLDGCDTNPADVDAYLASPCWDQPLVFDVFNAEGRFLGAIEPPVGLRGNSPLFAKDDLVLMVVEDEQGAIMVKRYRLQRDT